MISETKLTARYAETDQMGVIHHAVYPVWYEVARTDFIKQAGMSYSEMEQNGVMLPLVELHCRYTLPARYENELVIRTQIGQLTPVKVEFIYEVYHNETLINRGSTLHAWTNTSLRPINMRKHFPEIFELVSSMKEPS